tara:strand:- start:638 stop:1381 length:744 start_codon:yes stop_codon:yes gene_type:complete
MAVKCDQLIYSPVNALTFEITGGTKILVPHKVNGEIQSLEDANGIIFSVGQVPTIKHFKYNINFIEQKITNGVVSYQLSMAKRTKASTFVMPMLGGTRRLFFWSRLFLNCFIKTKDDGHCIALLYRWSGDPLFLKFEKALAQFRDFRKTYDPSTNTVLFIFNIPKRTKDDFTNFLEGKYSKFSEQYKLDILRFHNIDDDGEVGQILWKDPARRVIMEEKLGCQIDLDSELLSIIDEEKETFNIENYV